MKGKSSFGKNNHQQQFIPQNNQANAAVLDFNPEHPTNNEPEIGTLNKEEIEKLRSFLTSIEKSVGSCSFAQSGNNSISHALSVSKDCKTHKIWVVDSGAIDHMTNTLHHFTTYTPCLENQKIRVADGTMASIPGKGTIPLTFLSLKFVLYVSKLSINLLSIHKLTKDLNCKVVFSSDDCVFQEPVTGMTIGLAKDREGLYFLDTSVAKMEVNYLYLISLKNSLNKFQIWLHFRLGHPSF